MNEKDFIDYFIEKRQKFNISQIELARLINVSPTTLCRIENKERHLNYQIIKAISIVLDIDLNCIKSNNQKQIFYD